MQEDKTMEQIVVDHIDFVNHYMVNLTDRFNSKYQTMSVRVVSYMTVMGIVIMLLLVAVVSLVFFSLDSRDRIVDLNQQLNDHVSTSRHLKH